MRKLLIICGFVLGLMLFGINWVFAAEPVFLAPYPESTYSISQSSVSISSETTLSYLPTDRYRSISFALDGDSSVVYYRVDGSTADVFTVGFPFVASTGVTIESNNLIGIQLKAGAADIDIRVIEKRK